MPEALYYLSQMDLQYALYEWLSQFGTCYCEVGGIDGRIDLVWQQKQRGPRRTVGLEVKNHMGSLNTVKRQLEKYEDWLLSDVVGGRPITPDGTVARTSTPLFDEVWLVTMRRESLREYEWASGQLHYNHQERKLEYAITPDNGNDTGLSQVELTPYTGEQQTTARIAQFYRRHGYWVSAEVPVTRPAQRQIRDCEVKRRDPKSQIDLIVVKRDAVPPITPNTRIHGIEVKSRFDASTRSRLREQLDTYLESGVCSHVSIAVPSEHVVAACEFATEVDERVGVLAVRSNDRVDEVSPPTRQPFRKLPVLKRAHDGRFISHLWNP
ncbi:hypothetical protein [Haloplanus natans]|uniref:hypothetical protein n=1 Tax=Haloplanus natans TaxID=376171 RepID=UPI0012FBD5BB|nr:hypothetical protein [Haloplanus natans]